MDSSVQNQKKITSQQIVLLLPGGLSVALAILVLLTNTDSLSDISSSIVSIALLSLAVVFSFVLFFLPPSQTTKKKVATLMLLFSPIISFFSLEFFTHSPIDILPRTMLLNVMFYLLIELILLFITKRIWIACDFLYLFSLGVGIANNMTIQSRNIPIFPWDIQSLGVGLSVMEHYTYTISWSTAASIVVLLTSAVCASMSNEKIHFSSWWKRLISIFLSICALFGYCIYLNTDRVWTDFSLNSYTFDEKSVYEDNGFIVSFLGFLKNLNIETPENYDPTQLEESLDEELQQSLLDIDDFEDATRPNVIILMDESFSDPSVLISNSNYASSDPLSFIHSLKENTISGYASVSVKGGNTPNSEFEVLTGLTMAFLPSGSIPFQQYINRETYSLVSQFNELGYQTVSMHPYYSSGWSREKIYSLFGFQTSYYLDDFYDHPLHSFLVRSYISDEALVNKIIDTTSSIDGPAFIYAVSMQNHGGYLDASDDPTFNDSIRAYGLGDDEELTTYINLLKYTDKAVEKLINYYQNASRPTIILFFGDHQPNDSVIDSLTAFYGSDVSSSAEAVSQRYEVPFFIWANFPIEEKTNVQTSLNYLGTMLLNAMDFPLTAFQYYLTSLENSIPSISSSGITLSNGQYYASVEELPSSLISTYQQLQYAALFDSSLDSSYLKQLFGYAAKIKN